MACLEVAAAAAAAVVVGCGCTCEPIASKRIRSIKMKFFEASAVNARKSIGSSAEIYSVSQNCNIYVDVIL